jgi:opacity protein-like surface antigen
MVKRALTSVRHCSFQPASVDGGLSPLLGRTIVMACRKFLPVIGIFCFVLATPASAADMPYSRPGPQVQEYFSNWYLRGDGGYRFNSVSGGQAFGSSFSNSSLTDTGVVGAGIGYKWSWFRADVTVDYGGRPNFSGNTATPANITSRLSNATAMLNGYIDLGSWWGVTPYVGGGIGYSWLKPADFASTFPPPPLLPATSITDSSRWSPSWAVMAGLSYAITPVFLIDASYRYLDIGEARQSAVSNTTSPITYVKYGSWTTQEIRLGLRYLIP